MDRVSIRKDIPYKASKEAPYLMDIFTPAGAVTSEGFPAVILIHGSASAATRFKDSRAITSWGRLLAASGVAAVSFNWDCPRSSDVDDLLRRVRNDAKQLGIDRQRLCLFAFSGGASESVRAALRNGPNGVRCVVSYYGDMRRATREIAGVQSAKIPPVLVAKGGRDDLVPAEWIDGFVTRARDKGVSVTTLVHPSGAHAFDLHVDPQSREIVRQTVDFILNRIRNPN
jgi:dienelactone hydrolase